jgi:hypothetical protein
MHQNLWLHVTLGTLAIAASSIAPAALAQSCPYQPTNDDPMDVEAGLPLAFPGKLKVFNLYWASDWDKDPNNLRRADIEAAMQGVIASSYSDRLCQYGVEGFQWEGAAQASSLCGGDPGAVTSTPGVFSFAGCEEQYSSLTGVPSAGGAPNLLTCGPCGTLPGDCFVDPLCVATPNPTGDRIYVLFLPKGTTIDDFGSRSCSNYGAYHFQIPSRMSMSPPYAWFFGVPPFVPGTQGRPINLAIIPTDCIGSVAQLMSVVTHELVEAATDPLPLAHWIDDSQANGSSRFDPAHIETLLKRGEVADLCGTTTSFTAANGSQAELANYWSNHDNRCVSVLSSGSSGGGGGSSTGGGASRPHGKICTGQQRCCDPNDDGTCNQCVSRRQECF